MDKLDRKILDLLQKDGGLAAAEIAERVGLSKAPCWRRIKRLQEAGDHQADRGAAGCAGAECRALRCSSP